MSAPGALCDISCKCNDLSLSGAKAELSRAIGLSFPAAATYRHVWSKS